MSECMVPVAESSRASSRILAVLSEFTVAGRALEDSTTDRFVTQALVMQHSNEQ